jgi:hypothetical protein
MSSYSFLIELYSNQVRILLFFKYYMAIIFYTHEFNMYHTAIAIWGGRGNARGI